VQICTPPLQPLFAVKPAETEWLKSLGAFDAFILSKWACSRCFAVKFGAGLRSLPFWYSTSCLSGSIGHSITWQVELINNLLRQKNRLAIHQVISDIFDHMRYVSKNTYWSLRRAWIGIVYFHFYSSLSCSLQQLQTTHGRGVKMAPSGHVIAVSQSETGPGL
jgi:hypothetical protein